MPRDEPKLSIFLVGCGGIGIEMINNILHMQHIERVEMTDMDVVELSNLSRQYIFTKEDIGLSKSQACEKYLKNKLPNIIVKAHVSMIQDEKRFPISFFYQFNYIINALDNLEARKHVSKMVYVCNLLKKRDGLPPLILVDLGTAGFKASAAFYSSLETSQICCRDDYQDAPIPVCTLRSKPTNAKHCAIFAKYLIERIFSGIQNELVDFPVIQPPISQEMSFEIIKKLFEPLKETEDINLDECQILQLEKLDQGIIYPIQTCKDIIYTILTQRDTIKLPYIFDKDDLTTRWFISAVTNIRCSKFEIPCVSTFQAAGDAGRIVPALSFANAMVCAVCSLHIQRLNCKNQMYFFDVRPPYVFSDEIGEKYKNCDFCCSEFGVCGVESLEGTIYTLNGDQVTPECLDNDSDQWFSSEDESSNQKKGGVYEEGRIYIQKLEGVEPRYVYTEAGNAAYKMLQKRISIGQNTQDSEISSSISSLSS